MQQVNYYTVQSLYNTLFGVHRNGLCYKINGVIKGQSLQIIYRKMTILWSFSYNSFVKFYSKANWEPPSDCVITNPCDKGD